jgi:phosphoribosylaminoimidazolecarboxamide formyltransferase / IMP cyclohydrolase
MTETSKQGLVKIRRALISVSDKTGIVEFARELKRFGVEIISTGGTANTLRDAGLEVRDVSDVTGFPEMMDGRIKTLHPKIHGALLSVRDNPEHVTAMREHGIEPIDMVVINLYPFEETIAREGVTLEEAIEQIDIGGPAMIRSAAKNYNHVLVLISPDYYADVLSQLRENNGATDLALRQRFATIAFCRTAGYDGEIFRYFAKHGPGPRYLFGKGDNEMAIDPADRVELSGEFALILRRASELRYGENPHQEAGLYHLGSWEGIALAKLLNGKEMSFNNYVDADAAWQLVCDFDDLACAIIKHTNPAGVASGSTAEEAYRKALACDPVSAFGGIVAFNRTLDEAAARAMTEIFVEVIIAPDYEPAALEVLRTKKNLRVLRAGEPKAIEGLEYKQISGGMLVQTRDTHRLKREDLKVVTKRAPSDKEIDDLLFAWTVCKHTKSNAIVYVRDDQTVGVGAGQMSRVDSVKLGAMRAQLPVAGSVLASDAFFPFRDGVDEAAKHGITAVIQPGGSVRDEEVIAAANEHDLAMVFTGVRHFKH